MRWGFTLKFGGAVSDIEQLKRLCHEMVKLNLLMLEERRKMPGRKANLLLVDDDGDLRLAFYLKGSDWFWRNS